MKAFLTLSAILLIYHCFSQSLDTSCYLIHVEPAVDINNFFRRDSIWRGGDGAASIDLGNGRVLWLFGDTFISDSGGLRKKAEIIRNSVAIQQGYDVRTATVKYYWSKLAKKPSSFFSTGDSTWYWPGHGVMIKDRLLIFLMKIRPVNTDFGFEAFGWNAVLISNPKDDPTDWQMEYIQGGGTFGTIAGSGAVISNKNFLYAFGAVEPATHEVYPLRWQLSDAYSGKLTKPQWLIHGNWMERKQKKMVPDPLFTGATEYSLHYDSSLKKYIQVQSYGFGEAKIGIRMADRVEGPWTVPYIVYTPGYAGIKRPFMYSAKAHPELHGDGLYITYNINSFDFEELLNNQAIYYPGFIRIKILDKAGIK